MKYQSIRGTRDIYGKTLELFNFVENICKKNFRTNGFSEIKTPIFENIEVFTRTLGTETDIVSKEMYNFKDKGDREISLRPEGTAPIVRAVVEHNLIQNNVDKKFFYIGPMFRYDRPQAGRYRQFYQIGAEIFGNKNSFLDTETIGIAVKIIKDIGLKDYSLEINSVGCNHCRKEYIKILNNYIDNKISEELCETCKKRQKTNILRIFDCKIDSCKNILKNAPKITDHLCDNCKKDFSEIIDNLKKYNIVDLEKLKINKNLVRGLDYYTGVVFEITTQDLGTQNAVCAGGRYDNLVGEFAKETIPAIGFALGLDRVVEILLNKESIISKSENNIFFITTDKEKHSQQILSNLDFIKNLREKNYIVQYNSDSKSIKSQIKTANDLGSNFAIFIEADNKFTLKNMSTGIQNIYDKKEIIENFEKIINGK